MGSRHHYNAQTPVPKIAVPKEALSEFCRRHHIRRLALFGSVLREDFGPSSDVDVLVEFEPGHETEEYNAMYERFAPQFEREQSGEFVALRPGQEPLFGPDEETVLEQAIARFGRGNFAFWQVGKIGRWRKQAR